MENISQRKQFTHFILYTHTETSEYLLWCLFKRIEITFMTPKLSFNMH